MEKELSAAPALLDFSVTVCVTELSERLLLEGGDWRYHHATLRSPTSPFLFLYAPRSLRRGRPQTLAEDRCKILRTTVNIHESEVFIRLVSFLSFLSSARMNSMNNHQVHVLNCRRYDYIFRNFFRQRWESILDIPGPMNIYANCVIAKKLGTCRYLQCKYRIFRAVQNESFSFSLSLSLSLSRWLIKKKKILVFFRFLHLIIYDNLCWNFFFTFYKIQDTIQRPDFCPRII